MSHQIKYLALVCAALCIGCPADDSPDNGAPNNANIAPNNEGGREKPVVIDPCTAITEQAVSDALGIDAVITTQSLTGDSDGNCILNADGEGSLVLDVARLSNSADARELWETQTPMPSDIPDTGTNNSPVVPSLIETVDVDWSPDGELRVFIDQNSVTRASLWALVINTDYVNRDVYVRMTVGAGLNQDPDTGATTYSAPPIEAQKSALLGLGETLSDAIRAAQPEGVILP